MKNWENAKEYFDKVFKYCDYHTCQKINNDCRNCISMYNTVIEALEKTNTYKWHKIDECLPDEGDEVLVTDGKYYGLTTFETDVYDNGFVWWFDSWEDAIAWKYIEPYKESENV